MPVDEYLAAISRELDRRFAADANDPWELDTLYVGGGTPSRLGSVGIARLIATITARARLGEDAEVTVEANPDDVTLEAVAAWREAGVNRVSLGVQSFDDRALAWMHRVHDARTAVRAVDTIRRAGVENISVDLIFALPEELGRSWTADLERTIALGPTHLSLYGLTVEPSTPLGRQRSRGVIAEGLEETYAAEFLAAHETMTAAGFEHYEVSNFGRPGFRSRHNWAYWTGATYAGVGPAAHEYDGARRRWNVGPYEEWKRRVLAGDDLTSGSETLTSGNRRTESVYLGLRTVTGWRLSGEELDVVRPWVEAGWATIAEGSRLVLSPSGWLRLDALVRALTTPRSH